MKNLRYPFLVLGLILMSTCVKSQDVSNQKQILYTVSAEAHGFMCPFLTPKFISQLETTYGCKVNKTPDLVIHISCTENTELNPEKVIELADKIGYERRLIHVEAQ